MKNMIFIATLVFSTQSFAGFFSSASATATSNSSAVANELDQSMANGLMEKITTCLKENKSQCVLGLSHATATRMQDFLTLTTSLNSSVTKDGLKVDLKDSMVCKKNLLPAMESAKVRQINKDRKIVYVSLISNKNVSDICILKKTTSINLMNIIQYDSDVELDEPKMMAISPTNLSEIKAAIAILKMSFKISNTKTQSIRFAVRDQTLFGTLTWKETVDEMISSIDLDPK